MIQNSDQDKTDLDLVVLVGFCLFGVGLCVCFGGVILGGGFEVFCCFVVCFFFPRFVCLLKKEKEQ